MFRDYIRLDLLIMIRKRKERKTDRDKPSPDITLKAVRDEIT